MCLEFEFDINRFTILRFITCFQDYNISLSLLPSSYSVYYQFRCKRELNSLLN